MEKPNLVQPENTPVQTSNVNVEKTQASEDKAETALKEVGKLREEKVTEENKKSLGSKIGFVIVSFVLGAVGFFTWFMMKKTTSGLGDDIDLMSGPAGGLMGGISKVSLIIGITGCIVGLFLIVYILADHFRKKNDDEVKSNESSNLENKEQNQQQNLGSTQQPQTQTQQNVNSNLPNQTNLQQQNSLNPNNVQNR